MSTVIGGNPDGQEGVTAPQEDPDSNNGGVAQGGGAAAYVVVAGEDGAVRFYDLKFRLEVITVNTISRGG